MVRLLHRSILVFLIAILALSMVNVSYAATVKGEKGKFKVIYPDKIAVTQPYKVQIKVTSGSMRRKANVISAHGCLILNSKFEDEELKAKLPPIGQQAYTEYFGDKIVVLELASYPFANLGSDTYQNAVYDRTCKIEFLECKDDCDSLAFKFLYEDKVEFPINRDEALITNMNIPKGCDKNYVNFKESAISIWNCQTPEGIYYSYGVRTTSYPYKIKDFSELLYIGDSEQLKEYIQSNGEFESIYDYRPENLKKYNAGLGLASYYFTKGDKRTITEEDIKKKKTFYVETGLEAMIYFKHYIIVFDLKKTNPEVLAENYNTVKAADEKEIMDALTSFTLTDGHTDYDGEFGEDEPEKIDYKEEKKEPRYPLYDDFFDYDGDGMLNDDEYADYEAVELSKQEYFDMFYDDADKIEYQEVEPVTPVPGNEVVRHSDLTSLFARANEYEVAILRKSDIIVGEVKRTKEDIDKIAKKIQNLKASAKELVKDPIENKELIKAMTERIHEAEAEIKEKSKLQTDMIKSIDKEYSVLLKKIENDMAIAEDSDTRMVLEDKRNRILDNAKYAKINAYFHSGNEIEFDKFAKKYKYDVNPETTSKISLLIGLKKLQKGMPQSALYDFKSAMVSDPDNPMARELTNKVEGAYLDSIEAKLLQEMKSDNKAYNSSNQVGKDGAWNYAGDLFTTGLGSSVGALFGYETAKALESNVLQTEASQQVVGIKITKALMKTGMTVKEIKAMTKPEEFVELAKKFGKTITIEQAKQYRKMVYQAHLNPDVQKISDNSIKSLTVDTHKSYFKNNYDRGFTTNVLDVINVKNVLITLGPSATFTYAGELTTSKEFIRGALKIDKFQKALMTAKAGSESTKAGRLLAWTSNSLGKDLKTISQYGDARKFVIGQTFGAVENEVVGKGAEFVLGKEKGKVFADLYDGVMGFTGITDMGDLTDVAGKIDDSEFVTDFTTAISKGVMKKADLIEGKNLMAKQLDEATQIANSGNSKDARKKLLESLSSKDQIDDDVLDEMQKQLTKAKAALPDSNSKVAMLKEAEIDSTETAIKAYKNGDYDEAMKGVKKSEHMEELVAENVDKIKIRKRVSEKVAEIAEKAKAAPEKEISLSEMIKEKPLKVADTKVSMINIDANTGKVSIDPNGYLELSISINDNVPNKGWAKVIEKSDEMARAVGFRTAKEMGFTSAQAEGDAFTMKLLDLIVKKTVPSGTMTAFDTVTKEYVYVQDLPNSNRILVKVKPEEKKDEHEVRMAQVTNALVMTDTNFDKHVKSKRYLVIDDQTDD